MKKNLFANLSNKDLRDCYRSYARMRTKRKNSKEEEMPSKEKKISSYVDEYILMLEENGAIYSNYDNDKKYNIACSIMERDMLCVMARRYLRLCNIFDEIKPFFGEGVEALDYLNGGR